MVAISITLSIYTAIIDGINQKRITKSRKIISEVGDREIKMNEARFPITIKEEETVQLFNFNTRIQSGSCFKRI